MARRVLYILLAVMTFQLSWSIAAGYCTHETGPAANHFGHHAHNASADELSVEAKQKSKPATLFAQHDAHCTSQLHGSLAAPDLGGPPRLAEGAGDAVADVIAAPASAYPSPPERPQWTGRA